MEVERAARTQQERAGEMAIGELGDLDAARRCGLSLNGRPTRRSAPKIRGAASAAHGAAQDDAVSIPMRSPPACWSPASRSASAACAIARAPPGRDRRNRRRPRRCSCRGLSGTGSRASPSRLRARAPPRPRRNSRNCTTANRRAAGGTGSFADFGSRTVRTVTAGKTSSTASGSSRSPPERLLPARRRRTFRGAMRWCP